MNTPSEQAKRAAEKIVRNPEAGSAVGSRFWLNAINDGATLIQKAIDAATADDKKVIDSLRGQLKRYKFDEQANKEPKQFAAEINAVHPVNTDGSDATYELAIDLVSERRDKYEIVNLVNWLLTERDSLTEQLAQCRAHRDRLIEEIHSALEQQTQQLLNAAKEEG